MIIIAIRGTEPTTLQDWMTDEEDPPEISAVITNWQIKAQSLWLTGHSLGAALATLVMASLGEEDIPVNGLYAFWQPCVRKNIFQKF